MKDVLCIIQARMASKRLPGKSLMEFCDKPMLGHVIERVGRSRLINKVVIATTKRKDDDAIADLGAAMKTDVFRGSENDVLDRYYMCARKFTAGVVVRVTGDCPLIDPKVIDDTVRHFLENNFDYVSNAYPDATYPDGLDTEVFSFNALEAAWKEAKLHSDREHVTPYIWKNRKGAFSLGAVRSHIDLSGKRWTVDNKADAEFMSAVYKNLYPCKADFTMADVLWLLERNPELERINSGASRNEGYFKSLAEDGI